MPPRKAPRGRDLRAEFTGWFLVSFGLLLLLATVRGHSGWLTLVVRAFQYLFGMGALVIPLAMIFVGVLLLSGGEPQPLFHSGLGLGLGFLVFLGLVHMWTPAESALDPGMMRDHGGLVGACVTVVLRKFVGEVGAYVVLVSLAFLALIVGTDAPPGEALRTILVKVLTVLEWIEDRLRPRARRPRSAPKRASRATKTRSDPDATPPAETKASPRSEPASSAKAKRPSRPRRTPSSDDQLGLFPAHPPVPPHYSAVVQVLEPPSPDDIKQSRADSEAAIRLVESTLASFNIEAKVISVKRGPVVTRYEIQPAPGIRVSRITNLSDDLALALAALSIRVEAPVPGKSVIGIEVPNKRHAIVRLREILELDEFVNHPSKLTFAIGKDIAGTPMIGDLARMPHLLIGGATNSGKSVCLNSIITSILSRATPEEVKFSLIDPKRVELTLFQDIPHLFHPVVVDARDSIRALRGSIREMERRYKLFAEKGVRNITTYNQRLEEDEPPLYYIVIVIDEMADLMMQAAVEVERLICRLAQLARATGIHLVVATQRPSVNVITGIIKANISSRIAFAVASQMDSRVILDANGAERLLGSGDMLYHPIDMPKAIRLQGAYVDELEINRVVGILSESPTMATEYGLDLDSVEDEDAIGAGNSRRSSGQDPLFAEAAALVKRRRQASASMLQREFEIGYPRAGKIIDQLEQAGIIGPPQGSKPREVLVSAFDDSDLHPDDDQEERVDGYEDEDEAVEADSDLIGARFG